jgi:endonuclease YncB( thermonuclease family)
MKTTITGLFGLALAGAISLGADQKGIVLQVLDGDTFQLQDGRQVRCLGVDAPERGEPFADEATQILNRLVGGKQVRLELGRPARDRDGRLLAYVFVGSNMVNTQLLQLGAAYMRRPILRRYKPAFAQAQEDARAAGLGIWTNTASVKVRLAHIQARPGSGQPSSSTGEFVVLENYGDQPLDLTGWTLSDEGHHRYLFPRFVLAPKAKVTIHSGLGRNTDTDLFWGSRSPIWNNNGDTVFLRDDKGRLVLVHPY